MNTLVVGSGSVGQVVAYHLHRGGSEVSILVRNDASDQAKREYVLYPLNRRRARSKPVRSPPFQLIDQETLLSGRAWDQVFVCVPSSALEEALLGTLAQACGRATIVKFQPGLRDLEAYSNWFSRDQVISGMLSIISYQAPIADEQVPEPGTAYWFPPLLPCRFSGSGARLRQVVELLTAGDFPARAHSNVESLLGTVLATEAPLTAGLECAGWSLGHFSRGPWLEVAARAIREAATVASSHLNVPEAGFLNLIRPSLLRLVIAVLPRQRPVPLEAYLEQHFTKLRPQSQQHLRDYIEVGSQLGIPVGSIAELLDCLAV